MTNKTKYTLIVKAGYHEAIAALEKWVWARTGSHALLVGHLVMDTATRIEVEVTPEYVHTMDHALTAWFCDELSKCDPLDGFPAGALLHWD